MSNQNKLFVPSETQVLIRYIVEGLKKHLSDQEDKDNVHCIYQGYEGNEFFIGYNSDAVEYNDEFEEFYESCYKLRRNHNGRDQVAIMASRGGPNESDTIVYNKGEWFVKNPLFL